MTGRSVGAGVLIACGVLDLLGALGPWIRGSAAASLVSLSGTDVGIVGAAVVLLACVTIATGGLLFLEKAPWASIVSLAGSLALFMLSVLGIATARTLHDLARWGGLARIGDIRSSWGLGLLLMASLAGAMSSAALALSAKPVPGTIDGRDPLTQTSNGHDVALPADVDAFPREWSSTL